MYTDVILYVDTVHDTCSIDTTHDRCAMDIYGS